MEREMKNQSVGRVFFQHQFPILRKGGNGIEENQAVGVALKPPGPSSVVNRLAHQGIASSEFIGERERASHVKEKGGVRARLG